MRATARAQAGGMLDAQNICCESGYVDACGVCDGAGDACATSIALTSTARRRTRQLLIADAADAVYLVSSTLGAHYDNVTATGSPAGPGSQVRKRVAPVATLCCDHAHARVATCAVRAAHRVRGSSDPPGRSLGPPDTHARARSTPWACRSARRRPTPAQPAA
jgi:hypothetical protein